MILDNNACGGGPTYQKVAPGPWKTLRESPPGAPNCNSRVSICLFYQIVIFPAAADLLRDVPHGRIFV